MKSLKHEGRRAFLRGVGGVAVSLPLLEFTHGHAFASGGSADCRRFLTVFSHGGTISRIGTRGFHDGTGDSHGFDLFNPTDPGENLVLGPIMEGLEPHKSKLLVLQGIDNMAATAQDTYRRGGHRTSNVTALTAADIGSVPDGAEERDVALGPSIDQVIAERLSARQPVRFNRIHLKVRGHQYGSPYFRAAQQGVGGEENPMEAFASIFDGITADGGVDPAIVRRRLKRRNVLDGVLEGFSRFRNVVSRSDLHVIDAHLEHLNALQREIADLGMPAMCLPPTDIDGDERAQGDLVANLHVKIIVAALRCGLTNVANLEISDIITPWTPAGIRVDSAFDIGHSLGHYASRIGPTGESGAQIDDWLAEILDNRRWRMDLVRQLIEALDDPTFREGDRTMLDNSVLMYTSEFSEPAGHVAKNVPMLLAGSGGGHFRTGRNLDFNEHARGNPDTLEYETNESIHNVFTSILHAMGESDEHFGGDHSMHRGPVPGLT